VDEIGGRDEKCVKILIGKPGGKRHVESPRPIWEDNIELHLRGI
jgi:hypothetical protein